MPYTLCEVGGAVSNGLGAQVDLRRPDKNPCSNSLTTCCTTKLSEPAVPKSYSIKTECGIRRPRGVGFRLIGEDENAAAFGNSFSL